MTATVYATSDDLVKLGTDPEFLVACADDDGDGQADSGILDSIMESSNSIVDGYVKLNPGLPIDTVTGVLRYLAVHIAVYMMASRRRLIDESIKANFDSAIVQLEKIRDTKFSTGDTTIDTTAPSASEVITHTKKQVSLRRENLQGFPFVDSVSTLGEGLDE